MLLSDKINCIHEVCTCIKDLITFDDPIYIQIVTQTCLRQEVLCLAWSTDITDRLVHGDNISWFIFLPLFENRDMRKRPWMIESFGVHAESTSGPGSCLAPNE